MPAYNSEKYINEAIQSILNQTYTNWELLIANDCSSDRTLHIIDQFNDSRIIRYHNDINLGYLRTWNKLIQYVNGKYITFLDSDDLSADNRLELLVNTLEKNPEIGAVGSNFHYIDSQGKITETSNFHLSHQKIYNELPYAYHFIGSAIMIRKTVYEKIGGYNLFFDRIGAEDHYWIFLIMEKFQFINIPEALYFYRFNQNSVMGNLTKNPEKLVINNILEKLFLDRKNNGFDDLEKGNSKKLKDLLDTELKKIGKSKHEIYYHIAKRRFYEGHKKLAIKTILKAILNAPYKLKYFKDYFYFIRNK
jgi:glycosyltransferase involved in cell wall biosynthesis